MSYKLLQEEKTYLNLLKTRFVREADEDVKDIEVENPGILEVPEGKNVEDMGEDHFKSLIKKKGWEEISRALVNLIRWNKNRDKKLSNWADNMQEKLSKWVEKQREEKDNPNLYEIGPYVPPSKTKGGFGSIKGTTSSGGFGSIKGKPMEQEEADEEGGAPFEKKRRAEYAEEEAPFEKKKKKY